MSESEQNIIEFTFTHTHSYIHTECEHGQAAESINDIHIGWEKESEWAKEKETETETETEKCGKYENAIEREGVRGTAADPSIKCKYKADNGGVAMLFLSVYVQRK